MNQQLSKVILFTTILFFSISPIFGLVKNVQAQGFNDDLNTNSNSFNSGTNSIVSSPITFNNAPGSPNRSGEYQPITPGGRTFFESSDFEGMVQKIFELTIYFTVILAVIMIIAGGVEYMGSESMFKKGEGKARIFAAISGLLIALVSILVISTLLPGGNGNTFEINIFND